MGTSRFSTPYLGSISRPLVFELSNFDVVNFRPLAPAGCWCWVVGEEIRFGQKRKVEMRKRRKADFNKRVARKNCDPFMASLIWGRSKKREREIC